MKTLYCLYFKSFYFVLFFFLFFFIENVENKDFREGRSGYSKHNFLSPNLIFFMVISFPAILLVKTVCSQLNIYTHRQFPNEPILARRGSYIHELHLLKHVTRAHYRIARYFFLHTASSKVDSLYARHCTSCAQFIIILYLCCAPQVLNRCTNV